MLEQGSTILPLISIVMCAYNVRPYIEEAVNSILQQTYSNIELLISDDGSTDGTREWLKSLETHPKVRLFLQEKNLGYVANKNFAISQANGTYITQNDSDDLSDINRLKKQIAVCLKYPQIKIVACGYYKIDAGGTVYNTVKPSAALIFNKYSSEGYPFWFPPLLVHREIYAEVGLFSNYFAGMGDDLYWTVKANEQTPIYCLPDVLYSYRDNPNSITNVLNDKRKLYISEIADTLLSQRVETGTDWLEEERYDLLENLEMELVNNKKFMSERYRIWALKYIDKGQFKNALKLLKQSFNNSVFDINVYRASIYLIRKYVSS